MGKSLTSNRVHMDFYYHDALSVVFIVGADDDGDGDDDVSEVCLRVRFMFEYNNYYGRK